MRFDSVLMTRRFLSTSPFRSGIACRKLAQFSFRHNKFRGATIQTDNKLRKYPHDGLVNVFQSGEVDAYLPSELALVNCTARLAGHADPQCGLNVIGEGME